MFRGYLAILSRYYVPYYGILSSFLHGWQAELDPKCWKMQLEDEMQIVV